MIRLFAAALLAATALSTSAHAMLIPDPEPDDARIRSVPYSPNNVVQIIVPAQGETLVVLSSDETKFDVSVSTKEWRHDSAGNTLVLSANPGAPTTVAHVVSYLDDGTIRRYSLELTAAAEGVKPTQQLGIERVASNDIATTGAAPAVLPFLTVRFTYAKEDAAAKVKQATVQRTQAIAAWRSRQATGIENRGDARAHAILAADAANAKRRCNFMWRGNASVLPTAACDTGAVTSFLWPGQLPAAAVFLVGPDGKEQSVTQSPSPTRPGLVVVPTTSQFWRVRRGLLAADLFDASFDPIGLDTGTGTISPRVTTRLRAADAGGQP